MSSTNIVFHSGMLSSSFDFWGKRYAWAALGQWTGNNESYIAKVRANIDNTLDDLAFLITGNKEDWKLLGLPLKVKKGQIIEISLLLSSIEIKLRDNVIKAIDKIGINFSESTGTVDIAIGDATQADILNNYFDGETKADEKRECDGAALLVYAKAVLDLLGSEIFNLNNYDDATLAGNFYRVKSTGSLNDVRRGDRAYFRNYDDYNLKFEKKGAYQAENVIKCREDKYWGHPYGIKSKAEWYEILKNEYNAPSPDKIPVGRQRTETVPGFDGTIEFINVCKITFEAFQKRRSMQDTITTGGKRK
jgi:Protein-glutamine gamma-glutamyltransferase